MSTVWVHSPGQGYVHDDTGLYQITARKGRWGRAYWVCERLTGGFASMSGVNGDTPRIGATRVRITVTGGLFRSPTLELERVRDTPRHPEAP
jgi:hypothetical protein